MARSKKTRKVNQNGAKVAPRSKKADRTIAIKKRDTGNKTGSRSNEGALQKSAPGAKQQGSSQDPRHGSKRPVALTLPSQPQQPIKQKVVQPKLTDEQKLLQLEEDPRLNQLLDQLEEGRDLPAADQQWLDKQLAKIEALMEKLGLSEEEDFAPAKPASDDDLLDKFESGLDVLKQYQNKD
ncbi:Der GTPase-activating protein YihI [Shewanella sp. NFH-SH190041]|uniref:Der GTPase-activating protein YihI n=1 Tax=Shewanella sp. NFH-SH190041 TaxID=2950245 RepID=UPI0021C33A0A|nr:Der GTPase-activating protein YihI [Shewanella sp. NFH-SH190041]BDM62748.1 Der GTPase-activating protein YihI [Shewanella sp. NFH-SH190041]